MAEPALVADCVRAMRDAVTVPVTVKHRLGLDYNEDYGFVRDFVGALHDAGCRVFIVHARNAVLQGLSPKENRQVPPLRYEAALRLKADFPEATIVLNGGLAEPDAALAWMQRLDGVMLGRAAWHQPAILRDVELALRPGEAPADLPGDEAVLEAMVDFAGRVCARGTPLRFVTRAMLGWRAGRSGARQWRRALSDARLLAADDPGLLRRAWHESSAN